MARRSSCSGLQRSEPPDSSRRGRWAGLPALRITLGLKSVRVCVCACVRSNGDEERKTGVRKTSDSVSDSPVQAGKPHVSPVLLLPEDAAQCIDRYSVYLLPFLFMQRICDAHSDLSCG